MEINQNNNNTTIDNLPFETIVYILSFLKPKDLCQISCINKYWNYLLSIDDIWKEHCKKDFLEDSKIKASDQKKYDSFKNLYKSFYLKFGKYLDCYSKIRKVWFLIEDWLAKYSPKIKESLSNGATEEELNEFEKKIGFTLPLEMRCSYKIHNGQKVISDEFKGLFGGYKFYDYHVNLSLLNLSEIIKVKKIVMKWANIAPWIDVSIPIIKNYNSFFCNFLLLKDYSGDYTSGRIITPSVNFLSTFPMANSFLDLLEDLSQNLISGNYEVSKKGGGQIVRYPMKKGVSETVTKGIIVKCSPLFIPEQSIISPEESRYFFSYNIQLYMPNDTPKENSCKLETRYWRIIDGNGHIEEVRGPGVVGLYPIMKPNTFFEYQSCCPLPTRTGTMGGTFQMISFTGDLFDIIVPEFHFNAPLPLKC